MTKRFELRLCSNGTYYVYENGTLTDIDFDKFNRESAYALIDEVNALYEENEQLKQFKEKVFTLIDKEIARNEKAIEWGKETGADSGSMGFYNHMLKRLKKELSE